MRTETTMPGVIGWVAAGLGMALAVGAAQAQPTAGAKDDTTGIYCVYNALTGTEDAETVAKVFLTDAVPDEDVGRAALVVGDAAADCAQKHMLSDSKMAAMADMGIYGAVIDHLGASLKAEGASARALAKMFEVYDGLSEEETDLFFESDWRSDVAFSGKLKQQLEAAGLPDKDTAFDTAFTAFEVSAMADQAIFLFLVDDL